MSASSSPTPGRLTVAEANEAIARAARPRTHDASVQTTRGESPADDPAEEAESPAPPLLTASIPLPELGVKADDRGDVDADADAKAEAPDPNPAPEAEAEAILAQAPPPPPLRPTPSPAPRPVEPEPAEPELAEPEPAAPSPKPEPEAPSLEPEPSAKPAPSPEPEPAAPSPEPEPTVVSPPIAPAAASPESKPTEPAEATESPRPVVTEPATEAPSLFREAVAPFATAQDARSAPVVVATPQVYFDSPEAAAPTRVEARPRWDFWPWKRSRSVGGGFPVETPAQLPPVQFPASYDSIAARPLVPCPDHARVVTPTAQQRIVFPSAQGVMEAPVVEKTSRLKALGARLHDKLERLRAWKDEHICKHIQNFKAALKGDKCSSCVGHGHHGGPIAHPLASPQTSPILATSQFGLY